MHFSTEPPGHSWAVCAAFVAGRRRLDDDGPEACCCLRLLADVGLLPWVEAAVAALDDDEACLFTGLFFGGLLFMNP